VIELRGLGCDNTVKLMAFVCMPEVVIVTAPVVAPAGTCVVTAVFVQLSAGAETPLNEMEPEVPKPAPAIVTLLPTCAAAGDIVDIPGTIA
jgi:hypothetical protein